MDADQSCTATFELVVIQRTLTVEVAGEGFVSSEPDGEIDCGNGSDNNDCRENYADGTQVELTAAATLGQRFSNWSGSCSGTTTSTRVTMDADKSCTATFVRIEPEFVALTIEKTGTGRWRTHAGLPRFGFARASSCCGG